jgi:hypothetical protein
LDLGCSGRSTCCGARSRRCAARGSSLPLRSSLLKHAPRGGLGHLAARTKPIGALAPSDASPSRLLRGARLPPRELCGHSSCALALGRRRSRSGAPSGLVRRPPQRSA